MDPKDQADDGNKRIAAKKGTWELAAGVLGNEIKAWGQKVID